MNFKQELKNYCSCELVFVELFSIMINVQSNSITTSFFFAKFQKVEYIRSTRSSETVGQFIRTGFTANQNTSVEISISASTIETNACMFCSRAGLNNRTFSSFRIGNVIRQDYYTTQQQTNRTMSLNTKYTIKADKNKFYVDGTLVQTLSAATFNSGSQMTLLCSYETYSDSSSYGNMRSGNLYHCKIRDNGTLVRDFYPVYRKSDNVIGLLDIVNKVFYTNQGSGSFTKGPNI